MKRWLITLFVLTTLPRMASAEDRPTLDRNAETACAEHPDGYSIQIQCDESERRCLWARLDVSLNPDVEGREVYPRQMLSCSVAPSGAWERLRDDGFELVEASLPASYGYARDERNRLFQTHFDLRRRFHIGAGDMLVTDTSFQQPLSQSVHFELGGTYEWFDRYDVHRHKYRFLEGSVLVAPFEVDALLFSWDKGRVATEPDLWVTTFIGEPERYDINLDIGPGLLFGRLWYGEVEASQVALVDLAQTHVNWELLQSRDLEDYLAVRLGGGIGLRASDTDETTEVYVYPEAALVAALRVGEKGLWEFDSQIRGRWGAELDSGQTWWEVRGSIGLERILIAVNDQPISLFVEPSVHMLDSPNGDRRAAQLLVGGRISFFNPTPQEPR